MKNLRIFSILFIFFIFNIAKADEPTLTVECQVFEKNENIPNNIDIHRYTNPSQNLQLGKEAESLGYTVKVEKDWLNKKEGLLHFSITAPNGSITRLHMSTRSFLLYQNLPIYLNCGSTND